MTTRQLPDAEAARSWLDRWDRQQEFYLADREERFAVIADVVSEAVARPDPLIVDLGCGPGSLSVRLLDRLPRATVVGIDADPVLLGLARAAYGERRGLRLVDADLRVRGWADALRLDRPADAVVSTTALHWLTPFELADVIAASSALLRPGGVFVDGDHLFEGDARPHLDRLVRAVGRARAARVALGRDEDWASWWHAVGEALELSELVGERGARPIEHGPESVPTVDDYVNLLHSAGFGEAGTVWQHGDDRVLVGVR